MVVDRQLRPNATVLDLGRTLWTHGGVPRNKFGALLFRRSGRGAFVEVYAMWLQLGIRRSIGTSWATSVPDLLPNKI